MLPRKLPSSSNWKILLAQAMKMFTDTGNTIPIIFLITDGSVEDERHICEVVKAQLINRRKICLRIYTFGIGILLSFVDVFITHTHLQVQNLEGCCRISFLWPLKRKDKARKGEEIYYFCYIILLLRDGDILILAKTIAYLCSRQHAGDAYYLFTIQIGRKP